MPRTLLPPAGAESAGSAHSLCARFHESSAIASAADSPPESLQRAGRQTPPRPYTGSPPPLHTRARTSSSSSNATASAADPPASLPREAARAMHEFPAGPAKDDRYHARKRTALDVAISTRRSQIHPPYDCHPGQAVLGIARSAATTKVSSSHIETQPRHKEKQEKPESSPRRSMPRA